MLSLASGSLSWRAREASCSQLFPCDLSRSSESTWPNKMSLLWAIVALVLLLATIGLQLDRAIQRRKRIANAIAKIPGPEESAAPFFANLRTLLLSEWAARQGRFDKAVLIYQKVQGDCMLYRNEGVFKHWIIDRPIVVALAAEFVESILSAPKQTNKSMMYFAFKSWLGEGLVTSNGSKWHSRRRVITPAFHSNILNDFLPSFDAPATRLINRLNDVKYTQPFEAGPIIAACTMDIFCETALGLGSDFQSNDTSNWAHAVHEVTRLAVVRMLNPLLWLDRLFYMSETGKQFAKSRDYMQNIAMKVILERRTEWVARLKSTDSGGSDWTDAWNQFGASGADNESQRQPGTPKRPRVKLAFLDMMLYQHLVEKNLSLKDVKEEVDTFMFAGQDTTAVTIGWALYMLGLNQTIQDKVRCEVNEIMQDQDEEYEEGEDEDEERDESAGARINGRLKLTNMTPEALTRLRYLEMVIKETLRYWPTVPNVSRDLNEDLLLGKCDFRAPLGRHNHSDCHSRC